MIVLHEADMSPSEIRRLHDAEVRRDERKNRDKKKIKLRKAELRQRQESDARKKLHLDWQMILAKKNEELRKQKEAAAAAKSTGGGEVISSKDSDATATEKGISNVVSVVGKLAGAGVRAFADRSRKKAEQAAEAKKKGDGDGPPSPPTGGGGSTPPPTPSPNSGGSTSPSGPVRPSIGNVSGPATNPKRVKYPKNPVRPSIGNVSGPATNPKRPTNEEYSCWREEFLYELGELRQKTKSKVTDKDPIIDIMKGKNKITIGPNVSESTETPQDQFDRRVAAAKLLKGQAKIKMLKYAASKHPKVNEELNTAAYMAKATPAITGRTKVMSDIHLSKQPGKGTAEMVRDRIRKLFLGDLKNYNPNYDFNGNTSDDNDVISNKAIKSESYDENDETFRQHSRERFSSDSGNETRKKRTSAVLKAMAALNKDVEPKAKKKKKKKTEQ